MPIWVAWIFGAILLSYNSFLLWRAWKKGYFRYAYFIYSEEDAPIYFWFFLVIFTITEFVLAIMLTLLVVSAIWGPVFSQR